MPSRNPVLVQLVQKQADAFNSNASEAERVAIHKEIERELEKERSRK